MAGGGETKRKAGIHLNFDNLLGKDDEPPPELLILGAAEMVSNGEEVDRQMENTTSGKTYSDKELLEKIQRMKQMNKGALPDGGEKLRAFLVSLEADADRRGLYKVGTSWSFLVRFYDLFYFPQNFDRVCEKLKLFNNVT